MVALPPHAQGWLGALGWMLASCPVTVTIYAFPSYEGSSWLMELRTTGSFGDSLLCVSLGCASKDFFLAAFGVNTSCSLCVCVVCGVGMVSEHAWCVCVWYLCDVCGAGV